MEYTYQFFTGGFEAVTSGLDALAALRDVYSRAGPGDVIIGWSASFDQYGLAADFVHRAGKKIWLWLPVFSELPACSAPDPCVSYLGRPQRGLGGFGGEDFRFVCPSSKRNRGIVYELYERHFAHLPFDGVFLDKIRHASFAGGAENGFGCFCKKCAVFYAGKGVDAGEIAELIKRDMAAFLPSRLENGVYRYDNPAADGFCREKAGLITAAVTDVCVLFQSRRLITSLDVFAPLLAPLAGQDIPALARAAKCEAHSAAAPAALQTTASFVKPMLYRITGAPAGLPYEISMLNGSFRPCGADAEQALKAVWGISNLYSDECMKEQLRRLGLSAASLRPGFEVNILKGICDSTPEYAAYTGSLLARLGYTNAVLSWNMFSDTGGNIDSLRQVTA